MSCSQTVLLSSQAQIIHTCLLSLHSTLNITILTFVHHDSSVENTILPSQLHHVILYADPGIHILVHRDVAEVSDVSLLGSRSSMVKSSGIEMSTSSSAVVREVSILVNMKAVLTRAETVQQS